MSISVHVHLISGRSATLEAEPEESIDFLRQRAQSALRVGKGRLLTTSGDVVNVVAGGTVKRARLRDNDVLTLQVGQVRISATCGNTWLICGNPG